MNPRRGKGKEPLVEVVEEPSVVYAYAPPRKRSSTKGRSIRGVEEVVERIQAGLPMSEFDALRGLLELSGEELAEKLAISRSTLARRKKSGKLDREESDRLVRFVRLYARAVEVLGDEQGARSWLKTPARALNFVPPLTFAETEAGAREVENVLGRIEYGVFS
jgi:putative toxin-antitoxin system antitoxin component (TIGR02293 family)